MAPLHDAVDLLPPVGLAELEATAALQTRVDRKYLLPAAELEDVLAGLSARVLQIGGRRSFGYASTYADTAELDSYAATAHRRRRRWKVRTRLYADSGEQWLEVKTRGPRGTTVKHRTPYAVTARDEAGLDLLDATGRAFVGATLAEAGIHDVDVDGLRPTLGTEYRRTTLLLPDHSRATVDGALAWTSAEGIVRELGPWVVVETKTRPGAASVLDRRLWSRGRRPVRISKFATGLAALDNDLPANRWHRTLSRLAA